ncbi:MAG: TolC family protein [Bacteroidetes bacterium QH_2_67_10]|nr:MAG: TolC family protein [Bacteroidetes bacterium QH_2_67_10]
MRWRRRSCWECRPQPRRPLLKKPTRRPRLPSAARNEPPTRSASKTRTRARAIASRRCRRCRRAATCWPRATPGRTPRPFRWPRRCAWRSTRTTSCGARASPSRTRRRRSDRRGAGVAFNERARQDDNPATTPITFQEFQRRQAQGRREAGVEPDGGGGNPFTVDNQFLGSLSITQPLFNGQAFVAIQGADRLEEVNVLAATREEQTLIDRTRETYYQALLAAEQARVTAQSAERTRETFQEVAKQVAAGTAPKFERVSARVELENLRAQLAERRSQAATAVDRLKRTIGFPVDEPVRLQGALNADNVGRFKQVSMQEAMAAALENRPDVRQAKLAVELRENDRRQAEAQYLPTVSAFANFDYTGRVADDRTSVSNAPNDPFTFRQTSRGFFADELWNPSVSVGLRLSWNLFGGFRRAAEIEQREVAVDQAEVDYRQLVSQVRLEVQRALRTLDTARERLRGQRANVERAELNYEMAQKRLGVGVATQLQLREASDQLDQARLSYLQAVYDYLTAKSAYETAVGAPVLENSVLRFTRR